MEDTLEAALARWSHAHDRDRFLAFCEVVPGLARALLGVLYDVAAEECEDDARRIAWAYLAAVEAGERDAFEDANGRGVLERDK
jgi:hypothetical protein